MERVTMDAEGKKKGAKTGRVLNLAAFGCIQPPSSVCGPFVLSAATAHILRDIAAHMSAPVQAL